MNTALMLIAHGSREAEANADLHHVVEGLRARGGYAIVEDAQRHVVKDAAEVEAEAKLSVRLAKGRLEVKVVSQE